MDRLLTGVAPWGRGLLGSLVMAFSLGTAVTLGEVAHAHRGVDGLARRFLEGAICSGLAVSLIVWIRRQIDGLPLRGLGFPGLRRGIATFGLGIILTAGAAAVTFGLGALAGWIRFGGIDVPLLARFLVLNTLIAFLFEALPEELCLRGYTYRGLSAGLERWAAAIATTALFLIVPALSSVVRAVESTLLGVVAPPVSLAPGGQDPVAYLILLTVFGAALIVGRITTGSVWAAIGVHLTFLAVNRVVLANPEDGKGWSASWSSPDAVLLIPAYLLLTAAGFLAHARWRGRHGGWRDRDVEGRQAAAPAPHHRV